MGQFLGMLCKMLWWLLDGMAALENNENEDLGDLRGERKTKKG